MITALTAWALIGFVTYICVIYFIKESFETYDIFGCMLSMVLGPIALIIFLVAVTINWLEEHNRTYWRK